MVGLGRQPADNVYVFTTVSHFKEDGTLIPEQQQQYVMIPSILEKLGIPSPCIPRISRGGGVKLVVDIVQDTINAIQYLYIQHVYNDEW